MRVLRDDHVQTFRIHFTMYGIGIDESFMPCESIKPADEKQYFSSESVQSSLQKKASKTDSDDSVSRDVYYTMV